MFQWPSQRSESGGCGMHTPSRDFVRSPRCAACSVIRKRASSLSNGAQKNALRRLRTSALGLVRPTHAPGSRSVQWRRTHPAGARGASCCVQALRAREARAAGVPGGQPLVHQALCLHVLAVAAAVGDGDDSAFYDAWMAAGNRLAANAEATLALGHSASASQLYLKAASCYATAYHPIFGTPVDPRLVQEKRWGQV